jgi:hypothetical protein
MHMRVTILSFSQFSRTAKSKVSKRQDRIKLERGRKCDKERRRVSESVHAVSALYSKMKREVTHPGTTQTKTSSLLSLPFI